jgi:hypothetical protein
MRAHQLLGLEEIIGRATQFADGAADQPERDHHGHEAIAL